MKKSFGFLILSALIVSSSLLNAATVNFPTDQPVIQNIEVWNRKTNFGPGFNYKRMQTLLTLKEINTPGWKLEAFYLEGWLGKVATPDEMSLITVTPTYYSYTPPSSIHALVTGTIGDPILSLTYGRNEILDHHLAALWHIHERELAVGDSFTIAARSMYKQAKYEILSINDETVDYSVEIETGFVTVRGTGFWNRKNGLVGQFSAYGIRSHEMRVEFSSYPQNEM